MRYFLFLLLSISANQVLAKLPKSEWEIDIGKLVYHVSYPLKKVEGVSSAVKGKGRCTTGQCEFLVAAAVQSFLSGDGNRDNHMLEVTKAALFPVVAVRVKMIEPGLGESADANVEVSFAGKSHVYGHVKIKTVQSGARVVTSGVVPVELSDFDVERPSLLAIKIENSAPVDFELTWK